MPAFGDVNACTDKFQGTRCVLMGMTRALHMLNRSIRQDNAILMAELAFFECSFGERSFDRKKILRVNSLHVFGIGGLFGSRMEAEDSKVFCWPLDGGGGDVGEQAS